MLELGRKEQNLLGGIWLQILVVALLVFAYTQAIRQLHHRREESVRLREQLTMAREEVARQGGRPTLKDLQAEVAALKSSFWAADALNSIRQRLEGLGQAQAAIRELGIQVGQEPVKILEGPAGLPELGLQFYPLTVSGQGTTQAVAVLLAGFQDPTFRPEAPLRRIHLKALELSGIQPVAFQLEWWVPVARAGGEVAPLRRDIPGPAAGAAKTLEGAAPSEPPSVRPRVSWGNRVEPFLSPFDRRGAIQIPDQKRSEFRLAGIIWDPDYPTCILNDQPLKLGDRLDQYRVVLMTPETVLLQKGEEELFLSLQ